MIISFLPEQAEREIGHLADLLIDAVESGASIGFMPPFSREEALAYWQDVIAAMRTGRRLLLVWMDGDVVQGSVQMDLEPRANGNHRADVIKLFVHRRARRRGLARALMLEVESTARRLGRTLLLMDTRKSGEAEKMCESLGYVKCGEIPKYARSSDGRLEPSVFYYCQLEDAES
jgi:ribosomal protein S18 acetylase RimI-like enzyme